MSVSTVQAAAKKLGAYELLREIGASSVGLTAVARNTENGRSALLVKVHKHVAKSPDNVEQFLERAREAQELVGTRVLPVTDVATVEGEPLVAYGYPDGETLATVLRRAGPDGLPLPVATRVCLDVLRAISEAHQHDPPLGHGELGPWCVHVGHDGITRVSGFGVDRAMAKFGLHHAKNIERLTYAAPERVKAMSVAVGPGAQAPDAKADAFSAAVLAWELVTRQRLFASRMEAAVVQKVLSGAIAAASTVRPEVSAELSAAIAKGLDRDPAKRASVEELLAAFEAAESASAEEVGELVSTQVDKSAAVKASSLRPRPPSGVAPKLSVPRAPTAPSGLGAASSDAKSSAASSGAVAPTGATSTEPLSPAATPGGARKIAPKARAKTLLGFGGMQPPGTEPEFEEKPEREPSKAELAPTTVVDDPAALTALAAGGGAPPLDEPSTLDEDVLVEEATGDEPTASAAAAKPAGGAPPAVPKKPSRRPPPPPRGKPADEAPSSGDRAKPLDAPDSGGFFVNTPSERRESGSGARSNALARLGPGAVIGQGDKRYELLAAVARGGMASVWAAREVGTTGLERLVAVKTMLPELSDDPDFETMFLDETRVASRIRHPNVAAIHEVGEEGHVMYLVMEWVEGVTLATLQKAAKDGGGNGSVPTRVLLRLAAQTCAGLHAAHELRDDAGNLVDLVHRDVTPANVLVGIDGQVKVVDFGIAKSKGRMHVTKVGSTVKGKTPYLSPEQLGGLPIDRRSDLFSFGALLYVLATGLHPFRGETELKTVENIALKSPAPPSSISPDIHPELEKLILRLLEKDPRKRFADAAEVQKELERIEGLLEDRATEADLGAYVNGLVGKELDAQRAKLSDSLVAISGDAVATAASPFADEPSKDRMEDAPTLDAPTVDMAPTSGAPTSGSASAAAALDVAPPPAFAASASASAGEEFEEEAPALPPTQRSPWTRVAALVAVGVVVGIGVIALIESGNSGKPAASSSASAAAPPTPAPTPAPTPEPTPEPVATQEPTATAEPEPTADPAASAEPSAEPTAEPAPTQTTAPTPPRPVTPRPRPKPTTTSKPKPYNPVGI